MSSLITQDCLSVLRPADLKWIIVAELVVYGENWGPRDIMPRFGEEASQWEMPYL